MLARAHDQQIRVPMLSDIVQRWTDRGTGHRDQIGLYSGRCALGLEELVRLLAAAGVVRGIRRPEVDLRDVCRYRARLHVDQGEAGSGLCEHGCQGDRITPMRRAVDSDEHVAKHQISFAVLYEATSTRSPRHP
jgi:hypothetical protein